MASEQLTTNFADVNPGPSLGAFELAFNFSEPVDGLASNDFSFLTGTGSVATITTSDDQSFTLSVQVDNVGPLGQVILQMAADAVTARASGQQLVLPVQLELPITPTLNFVNSSIENVQPLQQVVVPLASNYPFSALATADIEFDETRVFGIWSG